MALITGDLGPPLDGWTESVGAAIHLLLLKILQVGYNRILKALLRSSGPVRCSLDSKTEIENNSIGHSPCASSGIGFVCRPSKYVCRDLQNYETADHRDRSLTVA